MISLSGSQTQRTHQQSSVWLSFGLHVLGCAALYSGLRSPRIIAKPISETRFATRSIEFEPIKTPPLRPSSSGQSGARGASTPSKAAPSASAMQVPFETPQQPRVLQTLIQPDLPKQVQFAKMQPIPQLLMWAPASVAVTRLAPPPPQKELPKLENRPALMPPRERLPIANLRMAPTDLRSEMRNMTAANVTPLVIHGEARVDLISETPAKQQLQPVEASVISVSEVKLPQGRTEIPPSNQIASVPLHGGLQPGPRESQHPGSVGLSTDTGTKSGSGSEGHQAGHSSSPGSSGTGNAGQGNAGQGIQKGSGPGQSSGSSLSASVGAADAPAGRPGGDPAWIHISKPKDGRFSVVVVGSSQAEDYPESAQIWKGRLAYTVFLNVGNAKKWILQYSLPPSDASVGGRVDAPWPYDLSVPAAPSLQRQAIMVHGFLGSTGRLEQLSMVLPGSGADLSSLVQALGRWTFRPAASQGRPVEVEVLLIIPEDED